MRVFLTRKELFLDENVYKTNWLRSLITLLILSISVYYGNKLIDGLLIRYNINFFSQFFNNRLDILTNTLGGLGEVTAAILGIEITAVAIIVQLAANKYSPKIMDLFIRNRVNVLVFSFFVVTATNTVLVTNTITDEYIPYFSLFFTFVTIIINLVLFVPHFIYIFNFLRPTNFLDYVAKEINKEFLVLKKSSDNINNIRDRVNGNVDFIGDIALNSVFQGDRAVILLCLSTLRNILISYIRIKNELPEEWFKRTGKENLDPDFSGYSEFVMQMTEKRKIILERKVFRLFELIFHKSHLTLRDAAGGVLLNTELIAKEAIEYRDYGLLKNIYQYFNSYLRLAITDKSPRTAFNTLEHYRILAEELIVSIPEHLDEIAFAFKYYGQEANKNKVLFILETAAHDLCRLIEISYLTNSTSMETLLNHLLKLDEPIEDTKSSKDATMEIPLIGVRIAQVKLAGFFLLNNDIIFAKKIFDDLKIEPKSRIEKIQEIIYSTLSEEFWEINPRGVNFYYMSEERRNALKQFFSWFESNN